MITIVIPTDNDKDIECKLINPSWKRSGFLLGFCNLITMEIEIKVKQKFDAKFLKVHAGVRYWEDSTINGVDDFEGDLVPFRDGDDWCPLIELETGIIKDWPKGTKAEIHYKVCDDGSYSLLDSEMEEIVKKNCYVPRILSPLEQNYGDYLIMNIDENGLIEGWNLKFLDDFLKTKSF